MNSFLLKIRSVVDNAIRNSNLIRDALLILKCALVAALIITNAIVATIMLYPIAAEKESIVGVLAVFAIFASPGLTIALVAVVEVVAKVIDDRLLDAGVKNEQ